MAAVAFVILVAFAVVVGRINAHRLRSDFNAEVQSNANQLDHVRFFLNPTNGTIEPSISQLVPNVGAVIRVLGEAGNVLAPRSGAPNLGSPLYLAANNEQTATTDVNGYRVVTFVVPLGDDGATGFLQYGQPLSGVDGEIAGLQLILFLGALIGTVIAFAAGSLVARRAMAPIAGLTAAAGEIARTRDPDATLPASTADDEVAELSRTLSGMLTSLGEARDETEATLERQRAFVADASHELRTPLTSVLANLELLVDSLKGADREAAESALRSTQRMRRLVADLLLLARTDAGQPPPRQPLDLADTVLEAASELESVSREHVDRARHSPDAGDRQPRRPRPRRHQPARERPAPHAAGHPHHGEHPAASGRLGGVGRGRRRPRDRRRDAPQAVRALRPRLRRPRRLIRPRARDRAAVTAGPRRRGVRPSETLAGRAAAPASWCACPPPQTSTTTGRTIGRRRRRS